MALGAGASTRFLSISLSDSLGCHWNFRAAKSEHCKSESVAPMRDAKKKNYATARRTMHTSVPSTFFHSSSRFCIFNAGEGAVEYCRMMRVTKTAQKEPWKLCRD